MKAKIESWLNWAENPKTSQAKVVGFVLAVSLLVGLAVALPLAYFASERNRERGEACRSVGAEPVESAGRVRFCALPDGVLVRIPVD